MTGGGGADVFFGDGGDDVIGVPDLSFESMDGGTGNDTLALTGGGINLNLASLHDKISNIEAINLTGNGDNLLTVAPIDVLNLSDTSDTLIVTGNAGDRLVLNNDWADGGIQGDFHTYLRHGAVLMVDVAVHSDPVAPGVVSLANLNGNNGFRLDGGSSYDSFGFSVSSAGDVNGDGFDDVIVGAPFVGTLSGSAYIVFGKASGFESVMNVSTLNGNNGFQLYSSNYDAALGTSVSNAGDVNGDGFDDVIVNAPGLYRSGGYITTPGASYVVFGKASGFDATVNLSDLDGNNGFHLSGVVDSPSSAPVSSAGDVNGDGFDDLIIGVAGVDINGDYSGSSYVIFGKASGFEAAMSLSDLDGNTGFRIDGVHAGDNSGLSVSDAGDINGDGFDDLIIGSPGVDVNGDSSGSSYVVFGKASGFGASMNLSDLDGSNGFRLDGKSSLDGFGQSVSNAGDVNGDGFDDLIISMYSEIRDGYSSSFAAGYVVFGKASGFDAAMNVLDLDGSNGFLLDEEVLGDGSRNSVSGAGDVNNDGFDDLIIGVPDSDSSYIIFGKSDFGSGGALEIVGTPDDDQLKGTLAAEHFKAGDGDDLLIGRGGADIFNGDAGDDNIRIPDLNFSLIDGGIGNDVLHLGGKDINLNLADYSDTIHNIETICIYGKGDNTLSLTAADLLNLSDTTNTLKVNGNAGDLLAVLDSGWVDGGSRGFYHTYTQGDAVLLVGHNLTVDFI